MRDYELEDRIGKGGMGVVYRGRQIHLDRLVAIKFLSEALADDEEFVERFLREARFCARLNHPGIVRIHDTGMDAGRPFLVMELLQGETLRQRLKREPLPEEQTVGVARWVLSALTAAHEEGIIHRDVKPGNIFLCRDGTVKVMDFGIAKAAGEVRITGTGAQLGTPEYMSPEQVEGHPVDARTDLYSAGVVLYEMLTAKVPFSADTPLAVMHQHLHKAPPPLPTSVSPWLRKIVERALEKDPNRRYQAAAEMQLALETHKPGARSPVFRGPVSSGSDGGTAVSATARPARQNPGRQALGFGSAVFVLLVVILILLSRALPPNPTTSNNSMGGISSSGPTLSPADQREQDGLKKLYETQDYAGAEADLQEALQLDGSRTELYYHLGLARDRQSKTSQAGEVFREYLKRDTAGKYRTAAKEHLKPWLDVDDSGVDINEPKVESAQSYERLGSEPGKFWVYCVLKNNLAQIENQDFTWEIRVREVHNKQTFTPLKPTTWTLNKSLEKTIIWASWSSVGSSFPEGKYEYDILVNGASVDTGEFSVP